MAILGTVVWPDPRIVINQVVVATTIGRVGVGFNQHSIAEMHFVDWQIVASRSYLALLTEDLSGFNGAHPLVIAFLVYQFAERGISFPYISI